MSFFLTRQPLINHQGKIIATRLRLHAADGTNSASVVDTLNSLNDCWPPSDRSIFVNFDSLADDMGLLDWIAPANVTFELPGAPFCTDHTAAFVAALKEANLSLCYNFDAQAAEVFGSGAAFRFIGFDAASFSPAQLKALLAKTQPYWREVEPCGSQRITSWTKPLVPTMPVAAFIMLNSLRSWRRNWRKNIPWQEDELGRAMAVTA